MLIRQANSSYLNEIVPLFDQYRVFYKQDSDIVGAETFLKKRFQEKDSVIFIAYSRNKCIGFTQLYFSFSSVYMKPVLILNDLFVISEFRGKGVGASLLKTAQVYCMEHDHIGLALETAIDNPAQKLYERMGWEKDSHTFHYFWSAQ